MKPRWRWLLLLVVLGCAWASYSRPTYTPPRPPHVRLRLAYLERIMREGSGPGTALGGLIQQNSEWGLFTLSFTTYALASLAEHDPSLRPEAAEYIGLAIQQVLGAPIRQSFAADRPTPVAPGDTLPSSVLYLGHLNLMLGCHRQLVASSPYKALHDTLSARLYRRYEQATEGNLTSYPHLRWVPDNTVALASLALHSHLTGSTYAAAGRRWVALAKGRWLDPATGLLASQTDAQGRVREGPRGSMLGWSIWFLARFDSTFARQQYQRYQAAQSTNLGVLRLYRELPGDYTTGAGDVDSGPLLVGYGIPATAFACADAIALHDWRNAQRLRRVISLGSREIEENGELRYGVRLVDLDVSPLSEALLLWVDGPGPTK
ncbi:hypothetical protein GO988_09570 [Hymenobacter sp. HMF4947]|uniref:Linalool dehydratase/isomerase domain-containing protein n=1 Tax=Hymenobacter ginkgonis TaxID=2682976 RepID=A0A7K1TDU3_9BACT|nr:hypothetical protein [Hymenobacter ginkgonis]MVN76570.1 hypothetical protein [Hymenobacter ginkgonis]